MVLRRNDVKPNDKDVSHSQEGTKRISKVHAQRKFAQGSGMNSPVMTPVKERKSKVNGSSSSVLPVMPSKRPRTEDFLTFLCYRGTEKLPAGLDYFNTASKPDKNDGSGSSKQSSRHIPDKDKSKVKKKPESPVKETVKNKIPERKQSAKIEKNASKEKAVLRSGKLVGPKERKMSKIVARKQLVRGHSGSTRSSHPSILKRLGASRVRLGLRSGGQISPTNDDPKPERKPTTKLVSANVKKSAKIQIREKGEAVKRALRQKPPLKKATPKKVGGVSTRARRSMESPPVHPKSLNLSTSTRPSRKTKEVAALYMEMITKDLRSPEEESEVDLEANPGEEVEEPVPKKRVSARIGKKDKSPEKSVEPSASQPEEVITKRKRTGTDASDGETAEKGKPKKVLKKGKADKTDPPKKVAKVPSPKAKRAESEVKEEVRKPRRNSKIEPIEPKKPAEVKPKTKPSAGIGRRTRRSMKEEDVDGEVSEEDKPEMNVTTRPKRTKHSVGKHDENYEYDVETSEDEKETEAIRLTRSRKSVPDKPPAKTVKPPKPVVKKVNPKTEVVRRTRKPAIRANTKSESSSDESDSKDASYTRTRPRKNVVRYQEDDSDESEIESDKEVRPKRTRKSYLKDLKEDSESEPEFEAFDKESEPPKAAKKEKEEIPVKITRKPNLRANPVLKTEIDPEDLAVEQPKPDPTPVEPIKEPTEEVADSKWDEPVDSNKANLNHLADFVSQISPEESRFKIDSRFIAVSDTNALDTLAEAASLVSLQNKSAEISESPGSESNGNGIEVNSVPKESPAPEPVAVTKKKETKVVAQLPVRSRRAKTCGFGLNEDSDYSNSSDEPYQSPKVVPEKRKARQKSKEEPKSVFSSLRAKEDVKTGEVAQDLTFSRGPVEMKSSAPKPTPANIANTWIQAFKHAKIPKPGQQHGNAFPRKPFIGSPKHSPDENKKGAKTPVQTSFKPAYSLGKFGNQSPNRVGGSSPGSGPTYEPGKSNVYLSPTGSPKRDDKTDKKFETPSKSLIQLQYEKRSQELISSLNSPVVNVSPFLKSKELRSEPKPEPKPDAAGKHLNLPQAVDHTLRKMSPTTVSKKPVDKRKIIQPKEEGHAGGSKEADRTANLESFVKKKVNMTNEEIKRWLNDSTSTGIEHKDCGLFENNQCECSFRTTSDSMQNNISLLGPKDESKVDHGVVQPAVQLKELDTSTKFTAETISTCKVEEYKEKLMQTETGVKKETTRSRKGTPRKNESNDSCDYDFRFERCSNSPRESGSDLSSPPPRDDVSSSNDENLSERKSIFQMRRQAKLKRPSMSKSPSAFSAENESSVYAFEPDLPPPNFKTPFRRRSRQKSEEEPPASSSIAVQVNLETEKVLESSTQTEQVPNDGHLFYLPIEAKTNPAQVIQGVQVKLQSSNGPDKGVIINAQLVTKPSTTFPQPSSSRPLGEADRPVAKPEQKVRPLASTLAKQPPVQTVLPLKVQNPSTSSVSTFSQGTTTNPQQASQGTQSSPLKVDIKPQESSVKEAPKPGKSGKNKEGQGKDDKKEKTFPLPGTAPTMVEAPTFYPTEEEFLDPLVYIQRITPIAQSYGICRIVPPPNFKPECKVSDDMRFTAYNQYVHKMLHRWGPNVREMTAIKKYLATQSISMNQPPYIGGMEIDLPRLYKTVQQWGGLKEVIEKKRWAKVADSLKIPKAAQDRVTKLDDIYCKFLLPYDTLSHEERNHLLEEVEREWCLREKKAEEGDDAKGDKCSEADSDDEDEDEDDDDGLDECITKGRTVPLSGFFRIARNTMAMWFKEPDPCTKEVEAEFWNQVQNRNLHICVNSGSIDCGTWGYGFPTSKTSSTSRHPWNLKVLTNNSGSILRSIGPVVGVTVPTLHVGMLFSACCWYRDPHGLPWIEYLHTGASKIWYGVPDSWSEQLKTAIKTLFPKFYQDKPIWLASDTAMVPPALLNEHGVTLCRANQEPGQFIVVFPKAFTSTICTGYVVSESVYFAQPSWLASSSQIFKDIQESSEPPAFSLEKLIVNIATDPRSSAEVLQEVLPKLISLKETELKHRKILQNLGVKMERLPQGKGKKKAIDIEEFECEVCRGSFFLSMVMNSDDTNYCLTHAIETFQKDKSAVKELKLMYAYDQKEMDDVIDKVTSRIDTKTQKKLKSLTGPTKT